MFDRELYLEQTLYLNRDMWEVLRRDEHHCECFNYDFLVKTVQ
jgi:hypothetical protein